MEFKNKKLFQIVSDLVAAGDQPNAITQLTNNIHQNHQFQVLLGVTGSGKTFTMAQMIEQLNMPALILAPNKTLGAQLYEEFKSLFPNNAVEYFVSYYDYYQPEAYLPATNTYIEKDSAINEQIDCFRHSATRSLLERKDVIIVSSVSCIYGLGSPEAYSGMMIQIQNNQNLKRDILLKNLIRILYQRSDEDFHRGTFRVRGDIVEIFPPYEDNKALRVEFFGDIIENIAWFDPLRGTILKTLDIAVIYPGSHYVNQEDTMKKAIKSIQSELQIHLKTLNKQNKLIEAQRIEQRTYYDIEMIEEIGYCSGVENYSRHFTERAEGQAPPTLLEYFSKPFITFIDESHITIPQLGGMYRGDRARKLTLIEHGFRLPSALDNRPLNFKEFESFVDKTIFISATPGDYEIQKSQNIIVEQLIRPTGLLDPEIAIKPAKYQVDDLLVEIKKRIAVQERVLITTLTKKSAEDLSEYYEKLQIKIKYLHSDIHTLDRNEILKDLRLGVFDVLVGINLLREGLDLPEVSLVAVLDADKEGFLRSQRSLIQTIGRAARNVNGKVILYADIITDSIQKAINETERRRLIQINHNKKHGIIPQTIKKEIRQGLLSISKSQEFAYSNSNQTKNYDAGTQSPSLSNLSILSEQPLTSTKDIQKEIATIRVQMKKMAAELDFEAAATLRDEIKRLELLDLQIKNGIFDNNIQTLNIEE